VIKATINGDTFQFEDGVSILDACHSVQLDIPTLCNDTRLKPIGSCRMCLVQVDGRPHPLTSCNTHLADGMVISTHTPALEHERAMLLRMLAKDHPADVFRRFPEKDFHLLSAKYGLSETDFDGDHHGELLD
jgi:NADH dehydrogenase/NADH:ubiquinone oxidoreductase subunit G